jgi:hypothetical protein
MLRCKEIPLINQGCFFKPGRINHLTIPWRYDICTTVLHLGCNIVFPGCGYRRATVDRKGSKVPLRHAGIMLQTTSIRNYSSDKLEKCNSTVYRKHAILNYNYWKQIHWYKIITVHSVELPTYFRIIHTWIWEILNVLADLTIDMKSFSFGNDLKINSVFWC